MCTFNIFYIIFLCKCSIDLEKMCYPLIISPGFVAASSSCTLQCVPAHVYVTLKNGLSMRFARYARMARTSIVLSIYILFFFFRFIQTINFSVYGFIIRAKRAMRANGLFMRFFRLFNSCAKRA